MIPRVIYAEHKNNYSIFLRFSDGKEGVVDLEDDLYGEVFAEIKDLSKFQKFSIHPDFHTICWPSGADFAPEYLYDKIAKLNVHPRPSAPDKSRPL